MLPVAHHACTLATGALRSSCTIKVRPSGRTHFFAVFGGNAITADSSAAPAFRFTMLRTINENNPASLIRYTIYWRLCFRRRDQETFGAGKFFGTSVFFS